MLGAHLIPGYFIVVTSKPYWNPEWTRRQRGLLYSAAFASTVLPDVDVIYNALFRSFFNHSLLWTHSVFLVGGLAILWFLLRVIGWRYVETLVGLVVLGWFSHLLLDVVSHGTPLFYPLNTYMIGNPPARVLYGGIWYYLTDPIFLIEPLLFTLAVVHFVLNTSLGMRLRIFLTVVSISIFIVFAVAFFMTLPTLQKIVAR